MSKLTTIALLLLATTSQAQAIDKSKLTTLFICMYQDGKTPGAPCPYTMAAIEVDKKVWYRITAENGAVTALNMDSIMGNGNYMQALIYTPIGRNAPFDGNKEHVINFDCRGHAQEQNTSEPFDIPPDSVMAEVENITCGKVQ